MDQFAKVLVVIMAVNAVLSGAQVSLDKLAQMFPSLQQADSLLGKIHDFLSKAVDFLSANVPNK